MHTFFSNKDILNGEASFSEADLGRKGLGLSLMVKNKIPVPNYFVVPTSVFSEFIGIVSNSTNVKTLEELQNTIKETPLSKEVMDLIAYEYQKLSGFGKAWVAVRGSISATTHPEMSFSGQISTLLNVRDLTAIEQSIKEVYASLFSERMYAYLKSKKVSYGELGCAVVIQKMIRSEVSGILYPYDPITSNKNAVSIEAVYGLGDVLSDGSINPDIYTVEKGTFNVIEKKIVPQEWMRIRKIGAVNSLEHTQKIQISKTWQYAQKLDEQLIKEVAQIASRIGDLDSRVEVVEWGIESGKVYILQVKTKSRSPMPQDTLSPSDKETKLISEESLSSFISNNKDIVIEDRQKKEESKTAPQSDEVLLFTGMSASSGIVYGKALVINSTMVKDTSLLSTLLKECSFQTILVVEEFSKELENFFYKVGGIITNYGGINSDAAIISRELELPAIVGTRIATSFIQDGMLVKLDANSGTVYRVSEFPENFKEAKTEIDNSVLSKKPKKKILKKKVIPTLVDKPKEVLPASVVKLFIPPSEIGTSYTLFPNDYPSTDFELSKAIMYRITDIKVPASKKIKKLKKNRNATIYTVIPDAPSLDAFTSKKRALSAHGVRKTKRSKIILEVTTIYGVLNTALLLELGIDGLLYNIPEISKSYNPGQAEIDESFWKVITESLGKIKKQPLDLLGAIIDLKQIRIPLNSDIKALLSAGCNTFVVTHMEEPPKLVDISGFITKAETELLKKRK